MLFCWGRAILLQLAHPLVAAGVHEHSSFRATPWAAAARLHHTVRAMLALTFGTDTARERAYEGIRTIHRRVNGTLPVGSGTFAAGTPYSAEDPSLVLWVHLTLLDSALLVFELLVAPLEAAERDTYCREAAPVAISLGARDAEVPRTSADVRSAMDRMYASGQISVSGQARELAHAVMSPPLGRLVEPAGWLNRTLTYGLLPPPIRQAYGVPWDARRERHLEQSVRLVRRTRAALPDVLALWPEARRYARSAARQGGP